MVINREYRTMPLLAPAADNKRFDTDFYVEGYATTFDDPYVLYECDGIQYKEIIDRHALDGADLSDVIMQYDHGGRVFARTGRSNTLLVSWGTPLPRPWRNTPGRSPMWSNRRWTR